MGGSAKKASSKHPSSTTTSSTSSASASGPGPTTTDPSPQVIKVTDAQGNQIPLEHHYVDSFRSSSSGFSTVTRTSSDAKHSSSHLGKRQNSNIDNLISCDSSSHGTKYEFDLSVCVRPDVRAWSCQSINSNIVNDTLPTSLKTTQGSCTNNQICVDGIENTLPGHAGPVAYCADVENYINITGPLMQQMQQSQPLVWYYDQPFAAPGQAPHAVEAVFAGKTTDDQVKMQSISFVAQNGTGNQWNNLTTTGCTDCSSWGIQPVPQGTQRFEVTAVFPPGTTDGTMFWWSL